MHAIGLPQQRSRAAPRYFSREFQSMTPGAAAGQKSAARLYLAAIQRHVCQQYIARHRRQPMQQRGQRNLRGAQRFTTVVTPVSGSVAVPGASGATPSMRSAPPTTAENTGAEMSPP